MSLFKEFRDKILICVDCKEEFAFTIGAQEYFAERGFTEDPKRCRTCYADHKNRRRPPSDGFNPDDTGGEPAVWQPKIPPGFIPPHSGFNWNVPDSNSDQQH